MLLLLSKSFPRETTAFLLNNYELRVLSFRLTELCYDMNVIILYIIHDKRKRSDVKLYVQFSDYHFGRAAAASESWK